MDRCGRFLGARCLLHGYMSKGHSGSLDDGGVGKSMFLHDFSSFDLLGLGRLPLGRIAEQEVRLGAGTGDEPCLG